MELFLVLLYASVAYSYTGGEKCFRDCTGEHNKLCVSDRRCYLEVDSQCELIEEICLRKIYRKPRFIKKREGYCIKKNFPVTFVECFPLRHQVKEYFGKNYD